VGAVSNRVGQLIGVVTASGFAALIYAAGYIAINRTGEMLGVPASEPAAGTYLRGGYRFFLQSSAAVADVGFEFLRWLVPAGLLSWLAFASAVPLGWLGAGRLHTRVSELIDRWRGKAEAVVVLAAYLAAVAVTVGAAQKAIAVLEADNLWFREASFVQGLSEDARIVVRAIADGNRAALREMYRTTITSVVAGAMLLGAGLLLESRVTWRSWRASLRLLKWLPVTTLLVLVLLLPSLYGICYLVPNSVCVSLTLRNPEGGIPSGMLLSDMRADTIEILAVKTPPQVMRFKRDDLQSIELLQQCALLPGFATPPTSIGKGR